MAPERDLDGVRTLMFDFYGTVVDMQSGLTEAITPYLRAKGSTLEPGRVVTWWRRTHFEASMIDALLTAITRRTARSASRPSTTPSNGPASPTPPRRSPSWSARSSACARSPTWSTRSTTLKAHGYALVILSNGDPDMLERGVPYSGTAHLFDRVISVAEAGAFKPHVATYRTACSLLGVEAEQVLFVANHAFDCVGAKAVRDADRLRGSAPAPVRQREVPA